VLCGVGSLPKEDSDTMKSGGDCGCIECGYTAMVT
jgi:hypothetical protein